MKRNAVQCKLCNKVIESFHVHDFKWHKCAAGGDFFIDGGLEYTRRGGNFDDYVELSE